MATKQSLKGLKPTHPGELLREDVIPALGKSMTEIANLLRVSRQTLAAILNEKRPVTPSMALRFGKLLGNGPIFWINLQRDYDLGVVGKELERTLASIPTLKVAQEEGNR